MLQLSKILWAICKLKAGPQDLPVRIYLLVSVILAGIIVDSFATSMLIPNLPVFDVTKTIIIYNFVLLTVVYFLLKLIGYKERGVQTLTAIAGSGLFISLVLLPGLLMMNSAEEQLKSFVFLIMIDNIWRIVVNAHIFRHALSIGLLMAMILSVSYLLFGVLIADYLLPAQNP